MMPKVWTNTYGRQLDMKAKLPHAVRVGPKTFKVVYKTNMNSNGNPLCGSMNGPMYSIEISTTENRTREEALSCLFHETLHAILYVTGQSDSIGEEKSEEGLVVALENFLGEAINWKHSMWKDWKFVELRPTSELVEVS